MFLRADHATDGPCGAMRYNAEFSGAAAGGENGVH